MVDLSSAPVVNPDGSWYFPFLPNVVINAGQGVPFQAGGQVYRTHRTYGQANNFVGAIEARHIGNITGIPDLGIPGTSYGVASFINNHLCDAVAQAYTAAGDNVLAVVIAQYDTGYVGPISTVGYEIEVIIGKAGGGSAMILSEGGSFTSGSTFPKQAQAQVAARVQGQWIQALFLISSLLGLDIFTGGKVTESFQRATEAVAAGVSRPIQAASQGPAIILVGAGAMMLGLAYFLNSDAGKGFGGKGLDEAGKLVGRSGELRDEVDPAEYVSKQAKAVGDIKRLGS